METKMLSRTLARCIALACGILWATGTQACDSDCDCYGGAAYANYGGSAYGYLAPPIYYAPPTYAYYQPVPIPYYAAPPLRLMLPFTWHRCRWATALPTHPIFATRIGAGMRLRRQGRTPHWY